MTNEDERSRLITKQDMENIQRAAGLLPGQKHSHDMVSIAAWVKQAENEPSNPFFGYHELQEEDGTFILGNFLYKVAYSMQTCS